jgi:hypothetical protein
MGTAFNMSTSKSGLVNVSLFVNSNTSIAVLVSFKSRFKIAVTLDSFEFLNFVFTCSMVNVGFKSKYITALFSVSNVF